MSCLALGYSTNYAFSALFTSFPTGVNAYLDQTLSTGINNTDGTFNGSSFLGYSVSSTDLHLYINRNAPNGGSHIEYNFVFDNVGTLSIDWQLFAGHNTATVTASYYIFNGNPSETVYGTLGSLNSTDQQDSTTTLATKLIDIPASNGGSDLVFVLNGTQAADSKDPAMLFLEITPVPEPGTWLAALLLLGTVSVTVVKSKLSQLIKDV